MINERPHLLAPRVLTRALALGLLLCSSSECTQLFTPFIVYDEDAGPSSSDMAVSPDLAPPAPPPTLSSVTPALGPSSGGIPLSIGGQNFKAGATVSIAGASAVASGSETLLTVTLPAQPGAFGKVPVVVQNPDGQMASRGDLFAYFAVQLNFMLTPLSPIPTGSGSRLVITGDVNGDKKLDLVAANFASGSVSVLLGDGLGGFAQAPRSPISVGSGPYAVAMGDFNSDQKIDVVTTNFNDNTVLVLLGDGTGSFTASPRGPILVGTGPISVSVADIKGD